MPEFDIRKANPSEYRCWCTMLSRCYNPNRSNYKHYGGRGITVCERWRSSFEDFLSDMGVKPTPKHSIDREKNSMGYEPGNCAWKTQTQQMRNTRNNRMVTANGKTQTLIEWAKESGINQGAIRVRLELGWVPERAVSEPVELGRNQFNGKITTIEYAGESWTINRWSKEIGIPAATIRRRFMAGWPITAVLAGRSFQGTREFKELSAK